MNKHQVKSTFVNLLKNRDLDTVLLFHCFSKQLKMMLVSQRLGRSRAPWPAIKGMITHWTEKAITSLFIFMGISVIIHSCWTFITCCLAGDSLILLNCQDGPLVQQATCFTFSCFVAIIFAFVPDQILNRGFSVLTEVFVLKGLPYVWRN